MSGAKRLKVTSGTEETDTDSDICKPSLPLKRSPPSTNISRTSQTFALSLYNLKLQLTKEKDAVSAANYAINFIKKAIVSDWIVKMQAILENIKTKKGIVTSSSGSDSSKTSGRKKKCGKIQIERVTTMEAISNNGEQFAMAFYEFYLHAIDITRPNERRYNYCKDALTAWKIISGVLKELKQAIEKIEATETVEPIDD
ncbi:uncharacterized protein LOC116345039 [Contarinia nasturtii]|uniref:uncharacterized protein LOC116345039 n=1 Tax=Contarinia nasturtii TaxID=265458 RepID=UPI0012D38D73|nr:uncharacterized protein LOC116345039 [Contarinia nasturtii]